MTEPEPPIPPTPQGSQQQPLPPHEPPTSAPSTPAGQPAAPVSAPAAPPGPPATAPSGPYQYPPGIPFADPGQGNPAFLAPPRPRVLWVNPQRRAQVAGIAVAIALVFGGGGIAIGWAASGHHDGGPGRVRVAPGNYGQFFPGQGRLRPNQLPRPAAPSPSGAATK